MDAKVMKIILKDKYINIEEIKQILKLNDEQTVEYLINFLEKEIIKYYQIKELNTRYFFYTVIKVEALQAKLLLDGKTKLVQSKKINDIKKKLYDLINKNNYTSNKYNFTSDKSIPYLNDLNNQDEKKFYDTVNDIISLYIQTKDQKYKKIINDILTLNETNADRLSIISKIFIKELELEKSIKEYEKNVKIFSHYTDNKNFIFTIDPEDIKLREDAISVCKNKNDYTVTLYITDPTEYYLNNTNAQNEMFNNWFIENKNITIDKNYAKENLSLDENKKRKVIAYELTFDLNYNIKNMNIYEDTIVVNKNYKYEDFKQIENNEDIQILLDITTKIKEENKYKNEYHLLKELNDKIKNLDDTLIKQSGYTIIEELKTLTNKIISNIFYENDLPCIYRNNKFYINDEEDLIEIKKCEGHDRKIIKDLRDKKVELISYYSNICEGHFGLNLDSYIHATTPLRNYFSLINTLILKSLIINGELEKKESYNNLTKNLSLVQEEKIQKKNKEYKKILINKDRG